ncbi:hypothetical protein FOYG_02263 [Fusarium oxysporum NRRL 32931]|uniref:Uncharacterized protein n=1 Tax=Fusarium oxysporum NRRL 32931 TaxID=660029 RepID=W9IR78_FUSOX|nr:hypothetical protein FOYG_02263 [Fusarium oxysporum NRRL 32931]
MKIIKETSPLEHSEAQSEYELQILAINFLSLKFKLCCNHHNVRSVYYSTLQSMKKSTLRDFVANVRDDIYSEMKSRPENRETSNHQLSLDFRELFQERLCPQNTPFRMMYFEQQAKGNHKAEEVLRELNQSLDLQIVDYSTDQPLQLIAATGVRLSQRCRVLSFDTSSSLPRDCWLIQDRFTRFNRVPDADISPQSRWSTISPRISQLPPIRPRLGWPPAPPPTPPQSPPQQQLSQILSSMQRLEQKVLNIHLGQTKQLAILVENDIGLGGIILSLACLRRLLLPQETIPPLIEESKQECVLIFVLRQIHMLRQLLGLPFIEVDTSIEHLQDCTNQIYNRYCDIRRNIIPIMNLPETEDSLPFILACLDQRASGGLGPVNLWKVKSTELAIIIGFFLGCQEHYAFPQHAQANILLIGTGIARGMDLRPSPANAPTQQASTMQHPTQQSFESIAGSYVDMEDQDQQSWDVQIEPENDFNADAASQSSS